MKLDDAVDQVRYALFSETTRPAVVFIDALNQVPITAHAIVITFVNNLQGAAKK